MNFGLRSYIVPTILALLFHGVLVFLTATTWFETSSDSVRVTPRHITAELVDLRSQNKAKAEQKRKADASKKAAEKKKKAAAKKKADAKRKAKQKAEQKAKQDKQRKVAAQKKAAEKKAAANKKADAKRKAESERLALAKKTAEQKRRSEAKRIADQAELEQQQQIQRELQRQAAQQRAQRDAQAKAEAEQASLVQAQQLVASAVDVIRSGIQSQWRRPPSARNGMVVGVRIQLLPTGEVDDAYVTKASGDEAFDRSAVNAVLKAERFPELQGLDPVVFDRYLRQITLEFRPEDLRL